MHVWKNAGFAYWKILENKTHLICSQFRLHLIHRNATNLDFANRSTGCLKTILQQTFSPYFHLSITSYGHTQFTLLFKTFTIVFHLIKTFCITLLQTRDTLKKFLYPLILKRRVPLKTSWNLLKWDFLKNYTSIHYLGQIMLTCAQFIHAD